MSQLTRVKRPISGYTTGKGKKVAPYSAHRWTKGKRARKVVLPQHDDPYHPPRVPQIVEMIEARGQTSRYRDPDLYRTLDYAAQNTAMMNLGAFDSSEAGYNMKHPEAAERPIFCPECGSLYIVRSSGAYCPRCKHHIPFENIDPSVSQVTQPTIKQDPTLIYEETPLSLKVGRGKRGCKHYWIHETKQTRSGDEGMTTWSICQKCGRVVKGYVPNRQGVTE